MKLVFASLRSISNHCFPQSLFVSRPTRLTATERKSLAEKGIDSEKDAMIIDGTQ